MNSKRGKNKSKGKSKTMCVAPRPLLAPKLKSRKKARQITRMFHAYTHELQQKTTTRQQPLKERQAVNDDNSFHHYISSNNGKSPNQNDATVSQHQRQEESSGEEQQKDQQVELLKARIHALGGRAEYQRASQLNTQHHSTSKWVLRYLVKDLGWLPKGIPASTNSTQIEQTKRSGVLSHKKQQPSFRPISVLEVGAVNCQLYHASQRPDFNLRLRAIDLHSMHPHIETLDFLKMPLPSQQTERNYFNVVVCSMVLNCVPTPQQRGNMLCRLYHQLLPPPPTAAANKNMSSFCFITLPKSCLFSSPFMNRMRFESMLRGIGFDIVQFKESPKLVFYILAKDKQRDDNDDWDESWTRVIRPKNKNNISKKYRTDFAIVLDRDQVRGKF